MVSVNRPHTLDPKTLSRLSDVTLIDLHLRRTCRHEDGDVVSLRKIIEGEEKRCHAWI